VRVIVIDESADMVKLALRLMHFYAMSRAASAHLAASAPSVWSTSSSALVRKGRASDWSASKPGQTMKAGSLCGLGQTARTRSPVTLRHFRGEYERYISK